uniref:Uncharacterized protein n=1 Tax=Utricularia reniformis TaxID=192314 RepID=A0A1Y0AZG9_9LAMI|nr:hypothetical protein AEK19_MT0252 [Utricularia reniformis]ART30529.1 hypothetical protein AEK19_MT0252 [Utricularia reniformis]
MCLPMFLSFADRLKKALGSFSSSRRAIENDFPSQVSLYY